MLCILKATKIDQLSIVLFLLHVYMFAWNKGYFEYY